AEGAPGSLLSTAGAMRAVGFLLAWALLHPAASQQCHPSSPGGVLRFTDRHAEIRVPALHRVPSSLDPLYGLVRSSLDLIQQNPLPTGELRAGDGPSSVQRCQRGSPVAQVVQYELGYVVCAAVALLFTVAVPVAGMCFCYCRSRRRCGGRLRAHRRSLGCRRRCLLACLSFTSLVILVTCAFVTSQRVKGQMEPGLGAVPSTLRTLRQHLANVPQVGPRAASPPAWDLQTSLHHLQILHRTARALAAARAELEPALRERRHRVVALLDDPRCTSCASVLGRAQSLELGADYSKVPSVEKVLKALAGLPRSDFAEMIRQGNGTFNSIPELAVERMAQVIQGEWGCHTEWGHPPRAESQFGDTGWDAGTIHPSSTALGRELQVSQPHIWRVCPAAAPSRWIAGTVLCSIILLILACNVTGMALGAYGLSKREDPSDYECRGEAGAKFLLAGVGLAFLFSWLLILLVFATFLVGGNIQTLVCRNWVNHEIYKFIDTPGNLPPSMNITHQLNLRRDSNLSSAECKSGAGLWEVLQLDRSYDLDEHLKTPKVRAGSSQSCRQRQGDARAVLGLLGAPGRQDLETFARSGVDEVDYGRFQEEMKNPVVQTSLPGLARNLEGLQKMQVRGGAGGGGALGAHGDALTPLCPSEEQHGGRAAQRAPGAFSPHFPADTSPEVAGARLGNAGFDRRCLPPAQELGCFTRKDPPWIPPDVASCQPLATALDNGRVILCDRIADPWNAFWFSLGCCTFFLIPNIIFAVRLTKHFRPIRNRLISTGSEETCPFHIPRVTALKL
uniref:Prominin 2 n=1 Tax=Catharus ustulatus TaxID=91951 RepID=A0A8C3UQX4_CATUS